MSSIRHIDHLNDQARKLRYIDVMESISSANKALELSMALNYQKGCAYARLYLAFGHFLQSKNKEALELLMEALVYFNDHTSEVGYPSTLTLIGNIYESFGNYETAMAYCQKAHDAAVEIDFREGMGEAQSVFGLIYSRLADYDHALDAYFKSLELRKTLGDQHAVASSLNRIARIYTLQKKYHEALEHYHQSLEIRKHLDQTGVIVWTYLGLASTYEEMGDADNAKKFYRKILSDDFEKLDDRCQMQARLGLGKTLYNTGEEDEAFDCYKKALRLANKLLAKPLQMEAHRALARYYETAGIFNLALLHYKRYRTIQEEILNDDSRNRLKNQQVAFAIEKSEREKEIFQLRNVELKTANDEINNKNKEITDSISYASRIQTAMFPHQENLGSAFPDHFIFFLPKNVVSGDFYWAAQIGEKLVFTAADCTGHGVPGALLSMLGISFLNELVVGKGQTTPGAILDSLRDKVIMALKQTGKEEEQKDGMDIALCTYDLESQVLEFAGAYNPLYLVRDGILTEYKTDRMPISFYHGLNESFRNNTIQLQNGDAVYVFSDGYPDQFGGPDIKKFKYRPFKEVLQQIYQEDMDVQKQILSKRFSEWKGDLEQVDDVLIIGLRI